MSAPTKRIVLDRDANGRPLPALLPLAIAMRFGFTPVEPQPIDQQQASSEAAQEAAAEEEEPDDREFIDLTADSPPVVCPTHLCEEEAVDAGGSSSRSSSRAGGISVRRPADAVRTDYPNGRCPGQGCQGACGGKCGPQPSVRCRCPSSNEEPLPQLCVHCKGNAAIRAKAVQHLDKLQQPQAIAAE